MKRPPNHLPRFDPGDSLTAEDMDAIADALVLRLQGGQGVQVRAFGGQVVIDADADVVVRRVAAGLFAIVRDDATLTSSKIALDIYGDDPASFGLDDEDVEIPPTEEDVLGWKDIDEEAGEYSRDYQYGELVTVTWVKASVDEFDDPVAAHYAIDKVHESALRDKLEAGQVAVTRALDGLALDAQPVMDTFLRQADQTTSGIIMATEQGRTIFAGGFFRSQPIAFWRILTAAETAALTTIYDTVPSYAGLADWFNYPAGGNSVLTGPANATYGGLFTFIRDDLVDVYPVSSWAPLDEWTHTYDWDSAGFGTFVGRVVVPADTAPNIAIPEVPEYRNYDWDEIIGTEEFNQVLNKFESFALEIYATTDTGAVAAKFWKGRSIDGQVTLVRDLTPTYHIRGTVVGTAECPVGQSPPEDGTYEIVAPGVSASLYAKFRWVAKDIVTTPYLNTGGAVWTF